MSERELTNIERALSKIKTFDGLEKFLVSNIRSIEAELLAETVDLYQWNMEVRLAIRHKEFDEGRI
jgi:hypothetical protein